VLLAEGEPPSEVYVPLVVLRGAQKLQAPSSRDRCREPEPPDIQPDLYLLLMGTQHEELLIDVVRDFLQHTGGYGIVFLGCLYPRIDTIAFRLERR